jgi:HEPN domain-containing protein
MVEPGQPYTHDLHTLLTALAAAEVEIPEAVWRARILTLYDVEARYPSVAKEVTNEQYAEALEIATSVVRWAEQIVAGRPPRR